MKNKYLWIVGVLLSLLIYQNCGKFETRILETETATLGSNNSNSGDNNTVEEEPEEEGPIVPKEPAFKVQWDTERYSYNDNIIVVDSDGLTVEKDDGALSQSASAYANVELNSGKWYFEAEIISCHKNCRVGIAASTGRVHDGTPTSDATYGYEDGQVAVYAQNKFEFIGSGVLKGPGDIVSVAIDLDNNWVEFYINGVSQVKVTIEAGRSYSPHFFGHVDVNGKIRANFGDSAFEHSPPSNFLGVSQLTK